MNLPRSLVLITVDCLRADHCGFLGYGEPTTPFLDSLAAESFIFRNAVTAGTPTYYAFPGIMASRPPLALGRDIGGISPGEATLGTVLHDAGYQTAAFLGGNPYLSRRYGYDAGFDQFADYLDQQAVAPQPRATNRGSRARLNDALRALCQPLGLTRRLYQEFNFRYHMRAARRTTASFDELRRYPAADIIVERAREWLSATAGRPFFLWLHLMDPHGPYFPPAKALAMMGHPEMTPAEAHYLNDLWTWTTISPSRLRKHRREVLKLYDAGIRWVDTQVGLLVETLRQSGVWENCVFALTADHGEEFVEHGGTTHIPQHLTEELVHVPLLLHAAEMPKAAPADTPFSLLHLAPTLLDALGLAAPENFRGISHWTRLDDEESWKSPVFTECTRNSPTQNAKGLAPRILAVREGQKKLILDFQSGKDDLFDLRDDPAELRPLPRDQEKPVRHRLLEQARIYIGDATAAADPALRAGAVLREMRMKHAVLS